ncbi:hypothetical protein AYI70_g8624 [Smittium culicis]|uniref:Uncharacterized protein n=1 Tax=Smittium culicis TaxID=133412 RepID=A0A1R1XF80_9FUNG|nr:hypothetical protein AYI70_g8624 [Smittium culicis]
MKASSSKITAKRPPINSASANLTKHWTPVSLYLEFRSSPVDPQYRVPVSTHEHTRSYFEEYTMESQTTRGALVYRGLGRGLNPTLE